MDPYIGQIYLFAGRYAPVDWMFCDGRLLPVSNYPELFTILGNTYGGDGATNFALPDLRGRAAVGMGPGFPQGGMHGAEMVTMTAANLPAHTHTVAAKLKVSANTADQKDPTGKYWATTLATDLEYATTSEAGIYMATDAATITLGNNVGAAAPINNVQPYACLNYIIAVQGLFPSQS